MNKPTNPNITIPESFAANGVKTDFDNNKILNGFDRIQPDVLAGDNLNKFIDDTYKGLNYSIAGTDAINLIQEDEVLTYKDGELVSNKIANLKNFVTNCILEAPNGVATYSGNTITLKAGLKVLMPDGLNADGTLKNIEYTLSSDITGTMVSSLVDYRYVFIDNDGILRHWRNRDIYYTKERPTRDTTRNQVWFDIENNYWYWANSGSSDWVIVKMTPVAFFYWDTTTISQFNEIKPINILKQTDKSQISGWGMPSDRHIDLILGASGSTYTAPANGWVLFYIKMQNVGDRIYVHNYGLDGLVGDPNEKIKVGYLIYCPQGNQVLSITIPVKKDDIFSVGYGPYTETPIFKFTYAVGSGSEV